MSQSLVALAIASTFTLYTPEGQPLPRIEAITDRGPILEMIVQCQSGTAIITYSKIEKLYCGPKSGCARDRDIVLTRMCS